MQYDNNPSVDTLVLIKEDVRTKKPARLVVYNDDYNTFDWVITCFMKVLNHDEVQSEQLAHLIHFKGKATVKTAAFEKLKPSKDALTELGLSAVIEHESDANR